MKEKEYRIVWGKRTSDNSPVKPEHFGPRTEIKPVYKNGATNKDAAVLTIEDLNRRRPNLIHWIESR